VSVVVAAVNDVVPAVQVPVAAPDAVTETLPVMVISYGTLVTTVMDWFAGEALLT
jgi:hypothetical protein